MEINEIHLSGHATSRTNQALVTKYQDWGSSETALHSGGILWNFEISEQNWGIENLQSWVIWQRC